jgi:outer membrane lipoprotein LolB
MAAAGRLRQASAGLAGLTLATLVAGCGSLPPADPTMTIHTGRFSAVIRQGGSQESVTGRFTLATGGGRTVLDLASPLGNTLARVEADAGGASLTAPRDDGTLATWEGTDADALAESVLGYRLPVTGLPDWIAGRAVAERPALRSPQDGPAQRIEQDGWIIVVDQWFDQNGLPRRLTLDRGTGSEATPALRLRLVLDDTGDAVRALPHR